MKKPHYGLTLAVKLLLMLSLSVLVYSVVQVLMAPAEAREALDDWEKKREEALSRPLSADELPLTPVMISQEQQEAPLPSPPPSPYEEGEVIGQIYFPNLDTKTAILEGTSREALRKGAGHYAGSAAIGASGNSVLAGHRDTVFRGLGRLEVGDTVEVETADGTFIYTVTGSVIVDGDERGAIKPSDEPILTLITCYPFSYVGPAPDRYLLSAALLRKEPPVR